MVLIFFGLFLFGEWHHQSLVKSYEQAAEKIDIPSQAKSWSVASLLQSNEVIVCVMDSYGRTEDLSKLSNRQKLSTSKSKLPSESGLWYMLFFSTDHVERIALLPYTNPQFDLVEESCGDSSATFLITPYFLNGEKKGLGRLSIKN